MRNKEILVLRDADKEIADFLDKVRIAGGLRVQVGSEVLVVKVFADHLPETAREFLSKGTEIQD